MKTLFNERRRRTNGRFATAEQSELDRLKKENLILKYRCESQRRELEIFNKMILKREL